MSEEHREPDPRYCERCGGTLQSADEKVCHYCDTQLKRAKRIQKIQEYDEKRGLITIWDTEYGDTRD